MSVANLTDVALHYQISGPADGTVIVFSNSLGTDLHLWDAQADLFSKKYRVLRYDARGHGGSTVPRGPYVLQTLGEDILRLLDFLDIERASMCGISLGGLTALWLAIHKPARFCSIVAANTAARIGSVEGWNQRIEQVNQLGLESLVDATLQRWFTPAFAAANPGLMATTARTFAGTSPAGYAACCAAIRDADLTGALSSIRIPVLVVGGEHDPVTPLSDARYLQAHIPGAALAQMGAAHLSNVEAAIQFNRDVLAFLETHPPGMV